MTRARHLAKALPDLATAALLYAVWSEPSRFGIEWFRAAAFGMLLEFFVIHAGGFMAVTVTDPEFDVAELGADAGVRAATGFDKGGGVWETEPHRALAAGVLYFAVMGLARPPLAWAFASR